MIRFSIVVIILILFLILSIPLVLIELLIGIFFPKVRDYSCLRIVQAVFRLMLFVTGTKITVIGKENVPKDCAVLYVCNHRSYLDILTTYIQCRGLTGYIAKDSMAKAPMLNVWMKLLHCLFLDRDNPREAIKTIKKGAQQLQNNISVCIFPEGTRVKTEGMLPFKEGSLRMAKKADCPVVPVAISNTAAIWENQFPKMKPAHVVISYGDPFFIKDLEDEKKKFAAAHTQQLIQNMLDENKKLIEQ